MRKPKLLGRVVKWREVAGCGEIRAGSNTYYFKHFKCKQKDIGLNDLVIFAPCNDFYLAKGGGYLKGAVEVKPAGWLDVLKCKFKNELPPEVRTPPMFISPRQLRRRNY